MGQQPGLPGQIFKHALKWKEDRMLRRKQKLPQKEYDRENEKPVLRCSICTGEQVAGFKNIHTGKFEEVMLIRGEKDLHVFMQEYGIEKITKEY